MIEPFVRQHDDMIGIADHILALAAADDVRADVIAHERLRFARTVLDHCRDEGAFLAEAIAQGRIGRAIVTDHQTGVVLRWRTDLMRCNVEWPAKRVARDSSGFALAFAPIADVLRRETRREEREVLMPASRLVGAPRSALSGLFRG